MRVRSMAVTALALGGAVVAIVAVTGRLGYVLDDAYIHLALAGGLADHGTFGIEPGNYESASSSPLWTLALAGGRLTPIPSSWLPLLLVVPCALAAAWLLARHAEVQPGASVVERLALWLLPITAGLVPLALTGMEHVAHLAVVVALLQLAAGTWAPRRGWIRPALLAVGTALRFETAFVALGMGVLTIRRGGDRRQVLRGLVADAAPVVVVVVGFAAVNLAFGQGVLPNSVLAKAATDRSLVPDLAAALERTVADPLLLGVLVLCAVLMGGVLGNDRDGQAASAATVVLVAASAHLLWADVGWFDRYQGYLVAGGVYVAVLGLREVDPARRAAVAAVLVLAVVPRTVLLLQTPGAARDIHLMHEQVGRFLVSERPGEAVALHDIGYPAYEGAGPIIDLFGLADHRLLELRRQGRLDRDAVEAILDEAGAELLVAFERPFGSLVPEGWEPVEEWCVTERVVIFDECFTFFADPAAAAEVRAELEDYAPRLPEDVERRVG